MPTVEDESNLVEVNPTRTVQSVDKATEATNVEDIFALTARPLSDGNVIDIFGTQKQQIKRKVKPVITKVRPIIKPTAPRLPFKYIGKLIENDVIKLFLMEGEALHIVSQGDKIGKNYRLKQVDEQQISLLYLPLNTTQTMSIGKTP